ncbi:MAG: diacylglycerol kinase family protein [Coriobacteriales bacterium]|nr:diacylglycerol kinase family protein [Coriobacteriales bacterium]MBQ6586776.1 diacylglycerol kinase family protein [Coriobacteriales bacterium]
MPEGKGHEPFSKSLGYAWRGFWNALYQERNLRIHLVIAILALLACAALRVAFWGWVVVICLIGLVVVAELINTAIESAVDLASPQEHPLAGRAKDIAAAAVLFSALTAVVAGLAIYLHSFLRLIGVL